MDVIEEEEGEDARDTVPRGKQMDMSLLDKAETAQS